MMLAISLTVACSRYIYNGDILHAHPVRSEPHNQRNATGEAATVVMVGGHMSAIFSFVSGHINSET